MLAGVYMGFTQSLKGKEKGGVKVRYYLFSFLLVRR
jgi:hypothetical protein